MGFDGHIFGAMGYLMVGLWELLNATVLYCKGPSTFTALPWYPSPGIFRYLELHLYIFASLVFIVMQLFIGPARHQPLDPTDWSIPSNHLQIFEHATIAYTLLTYSVVALVLDKRRSRGRVTITHLLAAATYTQHFFLFRVHNSDHVGIEGQFHWFLEVVLAFQIVTTLLMIRYEGSFALSFVRAESFLLQGIWLLAVGLLLQMPDKYVPKGCYMKPERGRLVARCHTDKALHRAKSLVNLHFCWCLVGLSAMCVLLYMFLDWWLAEESPKYMPGRSTEEEEEENVGEDFNTPAGKKLQLKCREISVMDAR